MNTKVIGCVWNLAVAVSTGYYVYKLTEDKTDELVKNSNAFSAIAFGAGRSALSTLAGLVTFQALS